MDRAVVKEMEREQMQTRRQESGFGSELESGWASARKVEARGICLGRVGKHAPALSDQPVS